MTETRVSWLSTAGVLQNGGIRPPGTEGMGASTGTVKTKAKPEKKASPYSKPVPATNPEKPITGGKVIFEGLYKFRDTVARVKKSGTSGKLYALVKNVETGAWEYEGRAPLALMKDSDRIVEEHKVEKQELPEGFYAYGAGVAEVVKSKAGRPYAKILDVLTGQWSYAKGVVTQIKLEDRLTLSQAAALGKKWERCMCCGKELTKQESIDRGIGPICAGRL